MKKILIAGGSGFVGRGLSKFLKDYFELTLLSRSSKVDLIDYHQSITWQELNESNISGYDIIINLCGYNIGQSRWSKKIKDKLINSRVEPTTRLVELIGSKDIWLINASAIGFYPFSKDAQDEENVIAYEFKTFSQEIVHKWESCLTSSNLSKYTILRFGVVIGDGGVLEKMSMTAKFGFLVKFASGQQLMTWVSLHDLCRAFKFVIDNELSNQQVFNLTSSKAATNIDIINAIKNNSRAKLVFNMPAIAIRALFGQMGEELLLSNQNILPTRLINTGFEFEDKDINKAIERYL